LRDQAAVQQFFLSEIQLGEELLSQGDVEGAVEHLGSAISVCGHPQQLLQILQSTLPPQVFHILIQRLPMIGQVSQRHRKKVLTDKDLKYLELIFYVLLFQSVKARHQAQFGAPINFPGGPGAGFPGMMGPPNPLGAMMGNPQILAMDEELE